MFGVPLDGAANMYCKNEVVYKNSIIPYSVLSKKHHLVGYNAFREAVASGIVRIENKGTFTNLVDLFTKLLPIYVRERLLDMFMY